MELPVQATLVMGAAVGYAPEQVTPFLESLRLTGYRGEIALLVDPDAIGRLKTLPAFVGVTLLPARQWLPLRLRWLGKGWGKLWLWRPLQLAAWLLMRLLECLPLGVTLRLRLQTPLALFVFPPTEGRFLRFHAYLRHRHYAGVLLSDVRDVLFQTEPFAALPQDGLAVSIESRRYTIATQEWNARWVRALYGDDVLRRIGDCPVSCSGVTSGDGVSMKRYLELMTRAIIGLRTRPARHGWFDQAIHNVVVRLRWGGTLHELDTLRGPVATLGGLAENELRIDADGRLLNCDGTAASVLHQYDRLPVLGPQLYRRAMAAPRS